MALPFPISAAQTDAKSPVDDNLMDSIRLDLDYLDTTVTAGGTPTYVWNINGILNLLSGNIAKRIDMQFLNNSQTFSRVRIAQEKSGLAGKTEIDIRYHSNPKTPITSISTQFLDSTTSIGQLGSAISTQAISVATLSVATQSITRAKTTLNVQSIINVGTNLWRYNLNTAPDTDFVIGNSVLIASCTTGANNGTFVIVEVNQSGHPSIVITNASGVAQTGAVGTLDLQCWSYNYVNPANANFLAGESVIMATHTTGANNGTFTIYKTNQAGNNIWIKNATGLAQAGAVGTAACTRWVYTYAAAAGAQYVVGEKARFAAHTTAANNGDFVIAALNSGGNNIVVSNVAGVAQAGVLGNATSLRWKYSFAGNPATGVAVGHTLVMASHTTPANNGTFTVVALNDTTNNNIIIYNALGVAQAGAVGTVTHTRKVVSFSSDQSLIYSTNSYIEMKDCPNATYNISVTSMPFKVLEVNRGGGANYNFVINVPNGNGAEQVSPAGYVAIEGKSIFTAADGSKPQVTADLIGLTPNNILKATYTGAEINAVTIPAQTYLGLYILSIQTGNPENLSVMLT